MTAPAIDMTCRRCQRAVVLFAADFDTFEQMHYVCFHYEFEHDPVDPDQECNAGGCPSAAVVRRSQRPLETEPSDPRFRAVARRFLAGDLSVLDFAHAFRGAMNEVTAERPLHGLEVDVFYELELWETASPDERVQVADRLRLLGRSLAGDAP